MGAPIWWLLERARVLRFARDGDVPLQSQVQAEFVHMKVAAASLC
jgi:hypothetical protein